jgi:hypothetical protein
MYGQFLAKALNKETDWDSDTIKVALVSSAYTPNQDTHDYWDDVAANEVSGSGYTAGGQALTGKTITYDGASNVIVLDANDAVWPSASLTARYAVVYDDSGATNAQKVLIGYLDFGSDQSATNGNFTVTWDATGIVRISVA